MNVAPKGIGARIGKGETESVCRPQLAAVPYPFQAGSSVVGTVSVGPDYSGACVYAEIHVGEISDICFYNYVRSGGCGRWES